MLTGPLLVMSFPYLMGPTRTCPHSQMLVSRLYPVPDQSNPCQSFNFLNINFNIILPSKPRLSELSPSFPCQNFVCTSPRHLSATSHSS